MRSKPTPETLMWTTGERVEFDARSFRQWADHYGYRFDVTTRIDRERASEPRKQLRVIFSWTESGEERLELGDREWDIDVGETPDTFLEVDETGCARAQVEGHSFVLDLEHIEYENGDLVLGTGDASRHLPCSQF